MSQQINLYNPIFLKQEKYFSAATMLQALAAILLVLVAIGGYSRYRAVGTEAVAAQSARQLGEQREQLTRMTAEFSAQGQSKLLQAEITRHATQLDARRAFLASVESGEFGNTAGFSGYFAAFARRSIPGVWLTGFILGGSGNELSLRGRVLQAELVPAYLKSLGEEEVMRGRKVTELKLVAHDASAAPPAAGAAKPPATGPSRYVEFQLSAPVTAPAPPKGDAKGAGK